MFDLVISSGILISGHNQYCPLIGSIGITDGVIEYVGETRLTPADGRKYIDAGDKIVMPGLVNGHCHGDMAFAKGLGDGYMLGEQMQVFRENNWFYHDISDIDRYYARMLTYAEALLSGTTLLMENMFWSLGELSFQAFEETGLRGALAEDIRDDFYRSDGFQTPERLDDFCTKCRAKELIPALGILPEEEFTKERLIKTRNLAAQGACHYTSHLAETTWRHEASVRQMGGSPVKTLEQYGLLSESYIGSHGVYLDDEDIKALAKANAKIVNTPLCEMKIADGVAPIPELIKMGVTVALGTDGAMWNNSNDIFREMKGMALLHSLNSGVRSIGTKDILDMATINGAKLFGLERRLGTLEAGKQADIITIDASQPHMWPLRVGKKENVSSNLVYCATGADVRDVFIGGRQVVENHMLTGLDLTAIKKHISQLSVRVTETLK